MPWPGTKQAGVCNADGKTVAAGRRRNPAHRRHPVHDRKSMVNIRWLTPLMSGLPDEVHVYDVGRMPHGQGGMDEAHQYTGSNNPRLGFAPSQQEDGVLRGERPLSSHVSASAKRSTGERDAVNAADQERLRAEEAKRNFEAATGEVRQRLQEDNQLKDALREQIETNRKLREQLEQTNPKASPSPSPSSSSTDALKKWGEQFNRPSGPTPAGTPTQ